MNTRDKKDVLLEMRNLQIEGFSDEKWHQIVNGVDLTLRRGEVLGLTRGQIHPIQMPVLVAILVFDIEHALAV